MFCTQEMKMTVAGLLRSQLSAPADGIRPQLLAQLLAQLLFFLLWRSG